MSKSIKFGDKDYSLVPERLKEMREANPRASIETEPTYNLDGSITFKATIIRDQADEHSARATGNARYTEVELKKPKAFEKLETVSVGRALAMLGYLNDGQVASTEEMEEFETFGVEKAIEQIKKADKRGEFEILLSRLNAAQQKLVTPYITARMKELRSVTANA